MSQIAWRARATPRVLERDLERMLLERNWSAHSLQTALNRRQPRPTDLPRPGNSAFSLVKRVAVACLGVKGSQVQILSSRRQIGRCFLTEGHRPLLCLTCGDVGARDLGAVELWITCRSS